MANRWSKDRVLAIKAAPWSERGRPEPGAHVPDESPEVPEQPKDGAPPNPRRFRINKKDLEEHGYTEGCSQCDHISRYGATKPGTYHTNACRTRIITEMAKTEHGQQRLSAWSERVDRTIAEQIEHADKQRGPEQPQPVRQQDERAADAPDVRGGMGLPAEEAHPAETSLD